MKNKGYAPEYYQGAERIDVRSLNYEVNNRDIDTQALTQLIMNGFIPPPMTLLKGLTSIAPFDSFVNDVYQYKNSFSVDGSTDQIFDVVEFELVLKKYYDKNFKRGERVSILFSGGKDSATLAFSINKLRPDLDVKLFFLENKEESVRVELLADLLNYAVDEVRCEFVDVIECYKNMGYFCGDLSVPEYRCALKAASEWSLSILDGSGNDLYSGHLPSGRDMIKYRMSKLIGNLPEWLFFWKAEKLKFLTRPKPLVFTFSYFPTIQSVYGICLDNVKKYKKFWSCVDREFSGLSVLDFKSSTRGRFLDNYQIYTKSFCNKLKGKDYQVYFPFCDSGVATYISKLSDKEKFTKDANKIYLRKYLEFYCSYERMPGGKQGMQSGFLKYKGEILESLSEYKEVSSFVSNNFMLFQKYPGWAQLILGLLVWLESKNLSIDTLLENK